MPTNIPAPEGVRENDGVPGFWPGCVQREAAREPVPSLRDST